MSTRQIILASTSPRRKQLLHDAGYDFTVVASDFEEHFDQSKPASEVATLLAHGKALAVARRYPEAIVIGADTIVVRDGVQLGKPADETEAKTMLSSLSGRSHDVVTGVAVICVSRNYNSVASAKAVVRFSALSEEFIDNYVATGTTFDKAGGYALQHPMLHGVVDLVSGRPDAVVGLPLDLVAQLLAELGIDG